MKGQPIVLLMYTVDGGGGVARTVVNLANALVESHDVEIVSVFGRPGRRRFEVDPRVRVTYLAQRAHELRNPVARRLEARPTALLAKPGDDGDFGRWTQWLLRRWLRSVHSGVVISTRLSLHVAVARWAREGVVTIAQEHGNFVRRSKDPHVMAALREVLMAVDAYVVLTHGDLADYEQWLPGATARLARIPNASSFPVTDDLAALTAPILVSGGRLEPGKAIPRMVEAFSLVADEFPQWQVHLYGAGQAEAAIRRSIARHGLVDRVEIRGFTREFDRALLGASAYLMTSRSEGFPMVLVEAMAKGLPLVAYDVPRGPADLIEDGVTGRLVPDGDTAAYAGALRQVMGDVDLRRRMGAEGARRARAYEMDAVAAQWEALFAELADYDRRS